MKSTLFRAGLLAIAFTPEAIYASPMSISDNKTSKTYQSKIHNSNKAASDHNRWIVQLNDSNNSATLSQSQFDSALRVTFRVQQQQSFAQQLTSNRLVDGVIRQHSRAGNFVIVDASEYQVAQLRSLPEVKAVFPDNIKHATLTESVPLIGTHEAWKQRDSQQRALKGDGITIAILDTGIDYRHTALGGCIGANCKVIGGYDFAYDDNDPMDSHGHGTHVAAIASGNDSDIQGVAPNAKLYAYKVLDDYGDGFDSNIIAAIDRALDPDQNPATDDAVDIINLSLGGHGSPDDPLSQAVNEAVARGVVVVVAAGNDFYEQTINSPGTAEDAITVANTTKTDEFSFSSSRGPIANANFLKPDVAAPGEDIYSATPNQSYATKSGTSMAAPHVAGAAALLLQAQPSLTPIQLKHRLMHTAKRLGWSYHSTGVGRIDINAALASTVEVDQSTLFLGLASEAEANSTHTFTVTHHGQEDGQYLITQEAQFQGVSVVLTPSEFELAPGQSQIINATIDIDKPSFIDRNYKFYQTDLSIQDTHTNQSVKLALMLDNYATVEVAPEDQSGAFTVNLFNSNWQHRGERPSDTGAPLSLLVSRGESNHLIIESSPPIFRDSTSELTAISRAGFYYKTAPQGGGKVVFSKSEIDQFFTIGEVTQDGEPVPFSSMNLKAFRANVTVADHLIYSPLGFTSKPSTPPLLGFNQFPAKVNASIEAFGFSDGDGEPRAFYHLYRHADSTDSMGAQSLELAPYHSRVNYHAGGDKPHFIGTRQLLLDNDLLQGDVELDYYYTNDQFSGDFGHLDFHQKDNYYISHKVATTGEWNFTSEGQIAKWQYIDHGYNDKQIYHSQDHRRFDFTSPLQYWAGLTQFNGPQGLLAFRRVSGEATSGFEEALIRTRDHNFMEKGQLSACGNTTPLTEMYNNEALGRIVSIDDCHQAVITYDNGTQTDASVSFDLSGATHELIPGIAQLQLRHGDELTDAIRRINGNLALQIEDPDTNLSQLTVEAQRDNQDPELLTGTNDGSWHYFELPLSYGNESITLTLTLITNGGNRITNIIPYAFELGSGDESLADSDGDGIIDSLDPDDDNDGVEDTLDAFPLNPSESVDSDLDGIGNNADTDDDNDGVEDANDAFPLDASRSSNANSGSNSGHSGSGGSGGGSLSWSVVMLAALTYWRRRQTL